MKMGKPLVTNGDNDNNLIIAEGKHKSKHVNEHSDTVIISNAYSTVALSHAVSSITFTEPVLQNI